MSSESVEEPSPTPAGIWPAWIELWVMPFIEESGLWPVLFAILGHVVVVIAPLLIILSRGGIGAAAPLTGLILLSFWLCKTEFVGRGVGPVAISVALTWLVSFGVAFAAAQLGVF